ncbi:unnamed protein product [Sphagnum tenellum]
MKTNLFAAISILFLFLPGVKCTNAATRNWVGTSTSNDFSVAGNWYEGIVPTAGDIVQIGVSYIPVNLPVLSTTGVTSIGSLLFGTKYNTAIPNGINGATLQLNGATALSGLSGNGTNVITFNNTYSTVNYAGASQTVYTSSASNVSGGISYYNLTASGSATKTVAGGTLTVSNNLSLAPASSTITFDLSANATVSAIVNFASNTLSTLIQGDGQNLIITGTAVNNGTINLLATVPYSSAAAPDLLIPAPLAAFRDILTSKT